MNTLYVLLGMLIAGWPLAMFARGIATARHSLSGPRDPLGWLIAKSPQKARALGLAGALLGVAALALLATWLVAVPWELNAASPYVSSSGGLCDPAGAEYVARINESSYWCGGGDTKCPRGDVPIAYDRRQPQHCRVRSNVDRPSLYELHTGLFGLAWLFYAAVAMTFREVGEQSRSYRAFNWLFFGTIGALAASAAFYPH